MTAKAGRRVSAADPVLVARQVALQRRVRKLGIDAEVALGTGSLPTDTAVTVKLPLVDLERLLTLAEAGNR